MHKMSHQLNKMKVLTTVFKRPRAILEGSLFSYPILVVFNCHTLFDSVILFQSGLFTVSRLRVLCMRMDEFARNTKKSVGFFFVFLQKLRMLLCI